MPEVNDFGPAFLENSPHDVNGGIVTVKQRGGGDNADRVTGLINGNFLHGRQITTGIGVGGLFGLLLSPTFAPCPAIC
jgi:hypothetical protein